MNKVERLIHLEIFQPSFRYTSIRWTHAQYCHLESFLKFPTPRPATKQGAQHCSTYEESYITCGVICAHLPSSTLQSNTFNIWMELTCWVVFMNLTHLSPTEHLTCSSFPCNKIIRWTNEEHAHLVSFLNFCPHSTLQRNTFNIWNKLTCRVILETYPPQPYKAKGSTYEESLHMFFPKQVYRFTCMGFLLLSKGCIPGPHDFTFVSHLSFTCLSFCWACWLHSVA